MTLSRSELGQGRRLLVATAVTRHEHHPGWDRPALAAARQSMVDLFTDEFGYRHLSSLGLDPTRQQLTTGLHAVCAPNAADPITEQDMLAVYITCHGHVLEDTGQHLLITSDTDPGYLGAAMSTVDLATILLRGTRVQRLLLMLDTCQSGRGGNEIAAVALERLTDTWGRKPGAGMTVIVSAQPTEEAATGMFPRLLRDAVHAWPVAGHGPHALDMQALVDQMNKHLDRPGHQLMGVTQLGMSGYAPPFLANPRHDPTLNGVDLAIQQAAEWRSRADEREVAFRDVVVRRAMGSHDAPTGGWWFTGRHTALLDLTAWLAHPDQDSPLRIVTGDPGSGKSAVLGLIATLTDPQRRGTVPIHTLGLPEAAVPALGVIDARLTAQQATTDQILQALADAAHVDAASPSQLLERLERRASVNGVPFTVLLDGVDEAATPHDLAGRLLAPLAEHAADRIRLLLGARPHMLLALVPGLRRDDGSVTVDLDADRYADPEAIAAYALRNLLGAMVDTPYRELPRHRLRLVAEAVAAVAGKSFLVARITATTLAAQPVVDPNDHRWRRSLPRLPGEAMRRDLDTRLGPDARRARDLLLPLAFAHGQGLPWEDIWAPLASHIAGRNYTDDDLLWLREHAGSYIVENTDHGRSVYRLYHQALIDHLRTDVDARRVEDAFVTILLARVPLTPDARTDWTHTHPYITTHLATHAADAGRIDEIVTDPEYLVHADPGTLTAALQHISSDTALHIRAVYSQTPHSTVTAEQRRHILAINATRLGDSTLASELAHNLTWRPRWATGAQTSIALRASVTTDYDAAVATTMVDGRPVAVIASVYSSPQVWDLTEGTLRATLPADEHMEPIYAVACGVLDGRPIAVTGGEDGPQVWDLTEGTLRAVLPVDEDASIINVVACGVLDGRSIAVTTSGFDMEVWDLVDGALHTTLTLDRQARRIYGVACTMVDDRSVVVACGSYVDEGGGWLGLLDLADGTLRTILASDLRIEAIDAVACAVVEGRPVAVTSSMDGGLRVWDLTDGTLRTTLSGHTDRIHSLACAVIDGLPVAVTNSDHAVRVWDLMPGTTSTTQLGTHYGEVDAVACTVVAGRPVAVTGGSDRPGSDNGWLGTWDLTDGTMRSALTTDSSIERIQTMACTVVAGRPVAVTGGSVGFDSAGPGWLRAVDLTDETLRSAVIPKSVFPHLDFNTVNAVDCTVLNGRPVAVAGGTARLGGEVSLLIWNLIDGALHPTFPTDVGINSITAVACATLDGQPVAVTTGGYVAFPGHGRYSRGDKGGWLGLWDLIDGSLRTTLTTTDDLSANDVQAVACTVLAGRPVAVTGGRNRLGEAGDGGWLGIWDLTDGTLRTTITIDTTNRHIGIISAVACTILDGRPIAVTSSTDGWLRMWDLTSATGVALFQHHGLGTVAFGINGEVIARVGKDLVVLHRVENPRTRPFDDVPAWRLRGA